MEFVTVTNIILFVWLFAVFLWVLRKRRAGDGKESDS